MAGAAAAVRGRRRPRRAAPPHQADGRYASAPAEEVERAAGLDRRATHPTPLLTALLLVRGAFAEPLQLGVLLGLHLGIALGALGEGPHLHRVFPLVPPRPKLPSVLSAAPSSDENPSAAEHELEVRPIWKNPPKIVFSRTLTEARAMQGWPGTASPKRLPGSESNRATTWPWAAAWPRPASSSALWTSIDCS